MRALEGPKSLVATATLADATTVDVTDTTAWPSSDPTLASVNSSGMVTPLLPGSVTITAQRSGLQAMSQLTIRSAKRLVADIAKGSVNTYDRYATGDTAPISQIKGATNTGISSLWGVVVRDNEIYVTDVNKNSISVWPVTATGDVAPTRTITNASLVTPLSIAIYNDEIYVLLLNGRVLVFPTNASGDTAPVRTIAGMATTLSTTYGLAVYENEIYVSDYVMKQIDVFPANGSGDIAPTRTIVGEHTNLPNPYGLKVANDEIYVQSAYGLTVFTTTSQGDTPPLRSIIGPLSTIAGVSVDVLGSVLFVTNLSPPGVRIFPRYTTGDQAPERQITGTMNTSLAAPREIVFY